jgi:hypothetical protein
MIRYYYEAFPAERSEAAEDGDQHCLIAILDGIYYWRMEWCGSEEPKMAEALDINGGFLSDEIRAHCTLLEEFPSDELRDRFGTMGNYIERAVQGFRSYIRWISPDPDVTKRPWIISIA